MLLHLLEDVMSTQPSLCDWAFGYLHCSQMKIQSTFQVAGLQENVFYFIPLLIWKCYCQALAETQIHTWQDYSCI